MDDDSDGDGDDDVDDDGENNVRRSIVLFKPLHKRKLLSKEPPPPKFIVTALPPEEQLHWAKAFDMYQMEFFYSSLWINDVQRKKLAKEMAVEYGLQHTAKIVTRSQVEAVLSHSIITLKSR